MEMILIGIVLIAGTVCVGCWLSDGRCDMDAVDEHEEFPGI